MLALLFLMLVWAAYRSPLIGLGLVLGISLLAWTFRIPMPSWIIGPALITSMDALVIALSIALGLRWILKKPWVDLRSSTGRLFLVFIGLMLLNIVRGFFMYAESAVGEARPYIYFVVVTIYLATYPFTRSQVFRITRLWAGVSVGLAGIALLRWGGILPMPIGTVMGPVISASNWLQVRSINAAETLFVLLMLFGLVILWINRFPKQGSTKKWVKGGAIFLFSLVVLMRHRSVWITMLTGGAVLLFYFRSKMSRFVWTGLCISLVLVTTLSLVQPQILASTGTTLRKSASVAWNFQGTTADWRLEGWIDILSRMSLSDYLLGKGFGVYFARETSFGSVAWNISPHSFYVRSLSRLGILGLLVFLYFELSLLRELECISRSTRHMFSRNLATILLVGIIACHAFFLAYTPPAYFGILLGLAMWMTRATYKSISSNRERNKREQKKYG